MNFRWLWLNRIPTGFTLTKAERRAVRRLARVLRQERPEYRVSRAQRTTRTLVFAGVLGGLFLSAPLGSAPTEEFLKGLIGVALLAGLFLLSRLHQAPFTHRALCMLGHDTCIDCGYVLKGLGQNAEHCPECGERRADDCLKCGSRFSTSHPDWMCQSCSPRRIKFAPMRRRSEDQP